MALRRRSLLLRIEAFTRIGHRDQVLLMAAWLLLGLSRLAILVLPFSAVRHALGERREPLQERPALHAVDLSDPARRRAVRTGLAITIAARHTPWRSECYPQALTARIMLGLSRIPHVVSFGVRRDDDGSLAAHAWVHAGDVPVTGGTGHSYTEVGSFAWAPRSRRDT
jgi:hypothetical protein